MFITTNSSSIYIGTIWAKISPTWAYNTLLGLLGRYTLINT